MEFIFGPDSYTTNVYAVLSDMQREREDEIEEQQQSQETTPASAADQAQAAQEEALAHLRSLHISVTGPNISTSSPSVPALPNIQNSSLPMLLFAAAATTFQEISLDGLSRNFPQLAFDTPVETGFMQQIISGSFFQQRAIASVLASRHFNSRLQSIPESISSISSQQGLDRQNLSFPISHGYQNPQLEDDFMVASDLSATSYVDEKHAHALAAQNAKAKEFIQGVIQKYLASLPEKKESKEQMDKKEFQKKLEILDPEIFILLPKKCLEAILASKESLTEGNVPSFFVPYVLRLEALRRAFNQNEFDAISTELARDADFTAALQLVI
jgi:hypothetical protein